MMKRTFLIAATILFIGTSAFAYDWSSNPGEGTEENPYQISTAEQMNAIGVDTALWDKHFKLTDDIDLSNLGETSYNVIGNNTNQFTGVFDGDGHIIKNLTINQPHTDYIGLFGYAGVGSEIRNLELKNIDVAGDKNCGGLSGYNSGAITACKISGILTNNDTGSGGLSGFNSETGTILNCNSSVDITTSRSCVGCLVGVNEGSIIDSCATGTVLTSPSYSDHIGGLVGIIGSNGTVTGCFATGDVTGDEYVGGLAGTNWGTIENCYATGAIHEAIINGGLVGRNRKTGVVKKCYSSGQVDYSGTEGGLIGYSYYNDNGTVINCFWDAETSGIARSCGGGTGLPTAIMKQMSVYSYSGWGESVWTIDEGNDYPRLAWENTGDPLITNDTFSFAGSGTEEDPYQIHTFEDLQLLSIFDTYWDKHFILTADIDLDGMQMLRIGTGDLGFTGVFEGGGHVISNYTLNLPGSDYVGLFGFIDVLGSVKNLELANVKVAGNNCVGGLAGLIKDSCKIINCKVTGEVTGIYWVGGLVGRADGRNMIVNNCSVTGTVKGEERLGGLFGFLDGYKSEINDCHAVVDVQGTKNYIGGLAGEIGTSQLFILRCYSSGKVKGNRYVGGFAGKVKGHQHIHYCYSECSVDANFMAGGLIGLNDETFLKYSYARGDVTAEELAGGLIGSNKSRSAFTPEQCYSTGAVNSDSGGATIGGLIGSGETVESSFWDVETSGIAVSAWGVGLSTEQMQTSSTFLDVGWDLLGEDTNGTEEIWFLRDGVEYPRLVALNRQPIAGTGTDPVANAGADGLGQVQLDGTASADPDGDVLEYFWYDDAGELIATGCDPNVVFGVGEYIVTLIVSDGIENSEPNSCVVTVNDVTPPELELAVSPSVLWPANNKLVEVTPTWTVSDNCDSDPSVSLLKITIQEEGRKKELKNNRDDEDVIIGDDGKVYLRAKRSGKGTGRVYVLTYQAVDDFANTTVKTVEVTVPHDMGDNKTKASGNRPRLIEKRVRPNTRPNVRIRKTRMVPRQSREPAEARRAKRSISRGKRSER